MGQSIDVTQATFEQDVFVGSHDRPVVIDFYATWCGPCQLLKPMLEKLCQEYDFTLAKVDIDQEPGLAEVFGVEGVPDVRLMVEGMAREGFVGVKPEPELRRFLEEHLGVKSGFQVALEAAKAAVAAGDLPGAKTRFDGLFAIYPDRPEVALAAAQFLLRCDQADMAAQMLSSIRPEQKEFYAQAEAMLGLVGLQQLLVIEPGETPIESPLDQAFGGAVKAAIAGDYEGALEGFLEVLERDRKFRNDGARKAMLLVFGILGESDPMAVAYRKRMMMLLY